MGETSRVQIFTHGTNAFVMFKFPARRESVFELRFPEHWGSPSTERKYGHAIRVHDGANTVQWEQEGPHHVRAVWSPGEQAAPWDREWSYTVDYTGEEDFLDIFMRVTYTGKGPWDGEVILACLRHRMADPFIDPDGVRTYLYRHDGPVTVNQMIEGKFPPHRMMGARLSPEAGPRNLAYPIMATFTEDMRYACFIVFENATSCSANFGEIHCIHSNPSVAGMKPGETRILRGRVYCIPARRPEDVLERFFAQSRDRLSRKT